MISDIERQYAIEQFYYREARLLDGRKYQQWLSLVSESIRYIMPARVNALVNNRQHGEEAMIAIDNELEGSDGLGCPIREEGYAHLFVRVDRAYKMNSWADNPPARTRRIIGNVELLECGDESIRVRSNFHLFFGLWYDSVDSIHILSSFGIRVLFVLGMFCYLVFNYWMDQR